MTIGVPKLDADEEVTVVVVPRPGLTLTPDELHGFHIDQPSASGDAGSHWRGPNSFARGQQTCHWGSDAAPVCSVISMANGSTFYRLVHSDRSPSGTEGDSE